MKLKLRGAKCIAVQVVFPVSSHLCAEWHRRVYDTSSTAPNPMSFAQTTRVACVSCLALIKSYHWDVRLGLFLFETKGLHPISHAEFHAV